MRQVNDYGICKGDTVQCIVNNIEHLTYNKKYYVEGMFPHNTNHIAIRSDNNVVQLYSSANFKKFKQVGW